ncbi:MAG TPA: hypothetical protein VGN00_14390 [Puia sp.]|jgi:hypothetical protein
MKKKPVKRNERIKLPGGCSMSMPVISPANWKTTEKVTSTWYFYYRFYEPGGKPGGKQVLMKGMNEYKTAEERRQITSYLLDKEAEKLKAGYNPRTDSYTRSGDAGIIEEYTPLNIALQLAYEKLTVAPTTKADIKSMLYWIPIAVIHLGWENLPVCEVLPKHIRPILDKCREITSRVDPETREVIKTKCELDPKTGFAIWSAHKYNKYRSNLMILFSELIEYGAIEQNPVAGQIKPKKRVKRIRKTLTDEERLKIDAHLRQLAFLYRNPKTRGEAYAFWRFMHIFFHSGCRESEILLVQKKHNTGFQRFIRMVKKGRAYSEEVGTVKDIVKDLWQEILDQAGPEDFLFSEGLRPGPQPINPRQITKRWRRWVKDALGIEADIYSLKHSNTGETAAIAGDQAAADHNAHKSTAMVINIYDTDRANRKHEELKKINNPFA